MEYKNIVERKSLRPKIPIHQNLTITQYKLFPKIIQKTKIQTLLLLLGCDGGWSLYFYFTGTRLLFLSLLLLSVAKKKENKTSHSAPQITSRTLNFLSCFFLTQNQEENLGLISLL
jgi:hypothetical protein